MNVRNLQLPIQSESSGSLVSQEELVKNMISTHQRITPDWPIAGVNFVDILTLLAGSSDHLRLIINLFHSRLKQIGLDEIDAIAALDARGFIFGAPLALATQKPFIAIRKKGKLPPPVISKSYELEYGSATIEITPDSLDSKKKIVLVDDVLATGGTAKAAIDLIESKGVNVVEALFIADIAALNGKETLKATPTYSCVSF